MSRRSPQSVPSRLAGRREWLWSAVGTGLRAAAVIALGAAWPIAASAQPAPPQARPIAVGKGSESTAAQPTLPEWTYADLADWADGTPMVIRAKIRSMVALEPARAPGLRPGQVRFYVEARTIALIAGPPQAGDSLRYLVDLPLDSRGKPPKRPKGDVLLFARTQPARPGELQLVAPDAQIAWSPDTEARVKGVLGELLAATAPPRVTAVREAIHVPGNLAGEGETQLFLATSDGEPASITVVHRPGASPRWSVSFSEVLDSQGEPPARETLTWYRLACFLPARLVPSAHVSASAADRARADADYRLVLAELGPCPRNRR